MYTLRAEAVLHSSNTTKTHTQRTFIRHSATVAYKLQRFGYFTHAIQMLVCSLCFTADNANRNRCRLLRADRDIELAIKIYITGYIVLPVAVALAQPCAL
jgi:hypothetical protein